MNKIVPHREHNLLLSERQLRTGRIGRKWSLNVGITSKSWTHCVDKIRSSSCSTLVVGIVTTTFQRVIVNDDQQDPNILAYLFIPNQFRMFRAMSSPIVRSFWLYLQLLILSPVTAVGWCHGWDTTQFLSDCKWRPTRCNYFGSCGVPSHT